MSTDLCFPVIKFSAATGVRPDNTVPWKHLRAENLFVIVKGVDIRHPDGRLQPDGKLNMRVVLASEVLESVDIAKLVDSAIETRRGAEGVGVTPQVEQLPIFGITKEALLALRYRLDDGEARRLQLRMVSTEDCKSIVSAFERRGMEFQEQRPHTTIPAPSGPNTTSAAPERIGTGNAAPQPAMRKIALPQPYQFTHHQHSTPGVSQTPSSPPQPPIPSYDLSQRLIHPPLLRRDELSTPREVMPDQPSASQIFRSSTTPSQFSHQVVHGLPLGTTDQTRERPSSTSHISTLEAIRKQVEDEARSLQTSMQPPSLQQYYSSEQSSSGAFTTANNALLSSTLSEVRPQTARPSSTSSLVLPDSQDFNIPPRRELPFKRPDSKCKNNEYGSQPSSSTSMTSTLPKPKLVEESSGSLFRAFPALLPKDSRSFQSGATSPLKRSFNEFDSDHVRPRTMHEMTASSVVENVLPPQNPSVAGIAKADSLPQPSAKPENLFCSHSLLENRPSNFQTVPRVGSPLNTPHETVDSPSHSLPKATGTVVNDNPTSRAFSAVCATTNDPSIVSVDEYATQSMQDRQAALEEFMIANLENPAFTKLCEDLENCWRRIALGL